MMPSGMQDFSESYVAVHSSIQASDQLVCVQKLLEVIPLATLQRVQEVVQGGIANEGCCEG